MAFLVGAAKSTVCAGCTAIGTVGTGVGVMYGGVTGDNRMRDGFAGATRMYAQQTVQGARDTAHGLADVGRVAVTSFDMVNVGGSYNPLFSVPNLTGYDDSAAKVNDQVYKSYSERGSFKDKDGDEWLEILPDNAPLRYNTKYMTLFRCEKQDRVIIGTRGTDMFDPGDYASDAMIVLGALPPERCNETDKFVMACCKRYGKDKVFLTGHSLGGCITIHVALKNGIRGYAFNPGAGPHDSVARQMMGAWAAFEGSNGKPGMIRVHRINTDPISVFVTSSDSVKILTYNKKKNGLAHSMDQFL